MLLQNPNHYSVDFILQALTNDFNKKLKNSGSFKQYTYLRRGNSNVILIRESDGTDVIWINILKFEIEVGNYTDRLEPLTEIESFLKTLGLNILK